MDDIKWNCNTFITFTLHTYIHTLHVDAYCLRKESFISVCLRNSQMNVLISPHMREYARMIPTAPWGGFSRSCSDNPRTDNQEYAVILIVHKVPARIWLMIYMLPISLSVLLYHHTPLILLRLTLLRHHSDTKEKHSNFSDTLYFHKI